MMEKEQERTAKSASGLVVFMYATIHVNLTFVEPLGYGVSLQVPAIVPTER